MLRFSKLVGTGNDFIFIDLIIKPLSELTEFSREKLALNICDRHTGVGADGIIFVEKNETSGFLRWDFYNRDGSRAEFCGNAARCFGRWAHHYLGRTELIFESRIGEIKLTMRKQKHEDLFVVQMNDLNASLKKVDILDSELSSARKSLNKLERVFLVNSGVPHMVCIQKEKLNLSEKMELVGVFRFHKDTGAAGANVTFLFGEQTESFERGVEDFTLSCGTGVLAAAICVFRSSRRKEISLKTPGGQLRVEVVVADQEIVSRANLIGPAEILCEGNYFLKSTLE